MDTITGERLVKTGLWLLAGAIAAIASFRVSRNAPAGKRWRMAVLSLLTGWFALAWMAAGVAFSEQMERLAGHMEKTRKKNMKPYMGPS